MTRRAEMESFLLARGWRQSDQWWLPPSGWRSRAKCYGLRDAYACASREQLELDFATAAARGDDRTFREWMESLPEGVPWKAEQ